MNAVDPDVMAYLLNEEEITFNEDKGEYLDHAGDMRKLQRSRTTVKLFSALRRGLIPGTELITEKRDSIFYEGD